MEYKVFWSLVPKKVIIFTKNTGTLKLYIFWKFEKYLPLVQRAIAKKKSQYSKLVNNFSLDPIMGKMVFDLDNVKKYLIFSFFSC